MMLQTLILAGVVVFGATSILAVLAIAADRLLPSPWVQVRHDLALGAFCMAPLVFMLALLPAAPAPPEPPALIANPTEHAVISASVESPPPTPTSQSAAIATPAIQPAPVWRSAMVLGVWVLGALALFARLGRDVIALHQLRAESTVVDVSSLGLSRSIDVRRSDAAGAPMVVGYWRPSILVGPGFAKTATNRPVLEHEIAHIQRGDMWWALVMRFIGVVFWWIVPLSILKRIVERNREHLCDSRAAQITGEPDQLAHGLLDAASLRVRQSALSLTGYPADLKSRVERLASGEAVGGRHSWIMTASLAFVLVAAAVIATPQMGAAQQDTDEQAHDPGEMESIIERMASANGSDADNPLYRAAFDGLLDEAISLLDAGANPNAVSQGDGTPLIGAVRGGHAPLVSLLIERGAEPNIAVRGDGAPLISAARLGRVDLTDQLLAAGADPNLGIERDGSPLISASRGGNLAIVERLLAAGADPNLGFARDGNPLIGAALGGHTQVVQRLIAAGADPNGYVYRDETPLINAAQRGHIAVAEILVEAGADVSLTVEAPHTDPGGPYRSPLSEARRNGHNDMVRWLEERGAQHRPPEGDSPEVD